MQRVNLTLSLLMSTFVDADTRSKQIGPRSDKLSDTLIIIISVLQEIFEEIVLEKISR